MLLYEMIAGTTPFYSKNRKFMFHCILNVRPAFSAAFSPASQALVSSLLDTDPATRLGSSSRRGGAREIMDHDFFR